jgi:hypothetical protein
MNRKDFFRSLALGTSAMVVAPAILLEAGKIKTDTSTILVEPTVEEFADNKYVFDVWRVDDHYKCRAVLDEPLKYGHILHITYYAKDLDRYLLAPSCTVNEFFNDKIKQIIKDENNSTMG